MINNTKDTNSSTQPVKAFIFIYLFTLSFIVVAGTLFNIDRLQDKQSSETDVDISLPEHFNLNLIPQSIIYDNSKLIIRGALSDEEKVKLISLLSDLCSEKNTKEECMNIKPFENAIFHLISKSSETKNEISKIIFYLALFGGALGSTLRLFLDFVGNAAYKGSLDFGRWWPLYFSRPITGAILGLIIIILLQSNIMSVNINTGDVGSLWWLGLSIISGFGTIDATERLRLTSKAIFGDSKK